MTTAPRHQILYMAMELSNRIWKLAFGNGRSIRRVDVNAGDQNALLKAVERAKEVLELRSAAQVVSCYEAGRDGFWIHRFLSREGIRNVVVDPASIEVNRRYRRVKTDRVDAEKLLRMLIRHHSGEQALWRLVRVPTPVQEDERRMHRELGRLKKERYAHLCRIKSLLVMQGIRTEHLPEIPKPTTLRTWERRPLPQNLCEELLREGRRAELATEQIALIHKRQAARLRNPSTESDRVAQKLCTLKGVGPISSWLLAKEFFAWRRFDNRRQVAALAGLTGSPYSSGDEQKDLGISKAGNRRVRWIMVEIAWKWLEFQPQSALSQWWQRRFGSGTKRMRRVGIVALARKLLVALWRYVQFDEMPEGAQFCVTART